MMKVVFVGIALMATACVAVPVREQTWKEIPATRHGQASADEGQRLLIGDTVRVHTKARKTHIFRVFKIEETAFHGTARNSKNYRVVYQDLNSMEVLRTESRTEWVPVFIAGGPNGHDRIGSASHGYSPGAGAIHLEWLLLLTLLVIYKWRQSRRHSGSCHSDLV